MGAIVGFETEPATIGNEISWIASGDGVARYALYSDADAGWQLVKSGRVTSGALMKVLDPHGEEGAQYRLEVVDRLARVIWADTGGGRSPISTCPTQS